MSKLLLFFLFFAGLPPLFAQQESLLIGPGDLLHVQFFDTPEMEQHPRVNDDGRVSLLFLGRPSVTGMTPGRAAETIQELAITKQIMRHPQVTITIEQYATQSVTVSGEVTRPGEYSIPTPRPIRDVLAMAGGLTPTADRNISLLRHDRSLPQADYFVSNEKPAQAEELMVYPGDSLVVRQVGFIYVLGDVERPGKYSMATNDSKLSMLQALAEAGSPNKTAILAKAKLLRKAEGGYYEVAIRVDRLESGKAADFTLRPDDVIFVPFSYSKSFALNSGAIAAAVSSALIVK